MKIKQCSLSFHNVITAKMICKTNDWYHSAREIRNDIIKSGLYGTGPVIYQVSNYNKHNKEAQYIFHVPVNVPVNLAENDKYSFNENLFYEDGLLVRHADLDEPIEQSYDLLRACAEANQLTIQEPFLNIYLDVYGDGIIDIYVPIVKEG